MTSIKSKNQNIFVLKFKELLKFLIAPDINVSNNQSIKKNIKDIFVFYILKLLISLLLAFIVFKLFDVEKVGLEKIENQFSPIIIILIGSILVPLFEETAFRLSLIFKPIYLSTSATLFFLYFISKLYFKTGYLDFDNHFILRLVLSILFGVLVFFISTKYKTNLNFYWNANFKWIYYFSIILFAFVHITNFEINIKNLMLMPLLTLPQLVGGIFNGYVRMNYGFIYAILLHSINNLVAVSFSVLF